nr:PD40 domain-containing protein [Saprospiraceae bacterium]
MNHRILIPFCLIIFCFSYANIFAQTYSAREYKETGDLQFENGKYLQALKSYLRYQRIKPEDLEVKKKIGICYFNVNDAEEAEKFLQYVLDNSQKKDPDIYLQLAKINHAQQDFSAAISFYKLFLREDKGNSSLRDGIHDNIKRCRLGEKLMLDSPIAQIENLGAQVNSQWEDYKPIFSPNNPDKIYFSSARDSCLGGMRNEKGVLDELKGDYSSDMFFTDGSSGKWSIASPMSYLLNSPRCDVLYDFNADGSVMYFYQGFTSNSGEIFTDTFKSNIEERSLFSPKFLSPILSKNGDKDLFFINDSTILFASRREGGFGGYDLYFAVQSNGIWSQAYNLGDAINSPYDEISPFLAKDGITLYFSNNGKNSVGGYDVFTSTFNTKDQTWETPQNIGMPINSAADDIDLRISEDGMRGFFASSRIQSIGMKDVYIAYFREMRKDMVQAAAGADASFYTNYLAKLIKENNESSPSSGVAISPDQKRRTTTLPPEVLLQDKTKQDNKDKSTMTISPLYYTSEQDILSPQNKEILLQIKKFYLANPKSKIELFIHAKDSEQGATDVFFTIKKAEIATDFLIKNGVPASTIVIKSAGAAYPYTLSYVGSNPNPTASRINNRIDFFFGNSNNSTNSSMPKLALPDMAAELKAPEGEFYLNNQKDLTYRIQIAAVKGIFNDPILNDYPNLVAEMSPENNIYKYTVGVYRTYSSAEQLLRDIIKQGYSGAFIVPYINGI